MKKFIAAVAVLSLVATPAFADHRGDRRQHDRGGVSTGEAVAIGVLGMVIGGVISRSNEERYRNPPRVVVVTPQQPVYEDRYYNPPRVVTRPQPIEVCAQAHYLRDQYGNIIRDQYGYDVVVPQRCWYQY